MDCAQSNYSSCKLGIKRFGRLERKRSLSGVNENVSVKLMQINLSDKLHVKILF